MEKFRDALIYNWAIASPDAHAKNYSVFLGASRVDLAPMYDIISYLPYAEGQPVSKLRTAMRIGDDYTLRRADRRSAWKRTADALRLDPNETIERAEDILRRTPAAISDTIDGLPHADRASPVLPALNRGISRRCTETLRELARQRSSQPAARATPRPGSPGPEWCSVAPTRAPAPASDGSSAGPAPTPHQPRQPGHPRARRSTLGHHLAHKRRCPSGASTPAHQQHGHRSAGCV